MREPIAYLSIYSFNLNNAGLFNLAETNTAPNSETVDEIAVIAMAANNQELPTHRGPFIKQLLARLNQIPGDRETENDRALKSDIDEAIKQYFITLNGDSNKLSFSPELRDFYLEWSRGVVHPENVKRKISEIFLNNVASRNIPLSEHLLISFARIYNLELIICERLATKEPLQPLCKPVLHVSSTVLSANKIFILKTLNRNGEVIYNPMFPISHPVFPSKYSPTYLSSGSGVLNTIRELQPQEKLISWPFLQSIVMDLKQLIHYLEHPEKNRYHDHRIQHLKIKLSQDLQKLILGIGELEKFPKLLKFLCDIPKSYENLPGDVIRESLQLWFQKIVVAVFEINEMLNKLYPVMHLGADIQSTANNIERTASVSHWLASRRQSHGEGQERRRKGFSVLQAVKNGILQLEERFNFGVSHSWVDPFTLITADNAKHFRHTIREFCLGDATYYFVDERKRHYSIFSVREHGDEIKRKGVAVAVPIFLFLVLMYAIYYDLLGAAKLVNYSPYLAMTLIVWAVTFTIRALLSMTELMWMHEVITSRDESSYKLRENSQELDKLNPDEDVFVQEKKIKSWVAINRHDEVAFQSDETSKRQLISKIITKVEQFLNNQTQKLTYVESEQLKSIRDVLALSHDLIDSLILRNQLIELERVLSQNTTREREAFSGEDYYKL